jgi:hypothetical protein
MRAHDAAAGARGERVPTSGGVNPEEEIFHQSRRRIRLRGRDETGENWGAVLSLPKTGGHAYGSGRPARVGDVRIGAEALDRPERTRDDCQEISAIAELQRRFMRTMRV